MVQAGGAGAGGDALRNEGFCGEEMAHLKKPSTSCNLLACSLMVCRVFALGHSCLTFAKKKENAG